MFGESNYFNLQIHLLFKNLKLARIESTWVWCKYWFKYTQIYLI